jgi:hypothetical protein
VDLTITPSSTGVKEIVELHFRNPSLPMAGYRVTVIYIIIIINIINVLVEARAFLLCKTKSFWVYAFLS